MPPVDLRPARHLPSISPRASGMAASVGVTDTTRLNPATRKREARRLLETDHSLKRLSDSRLHLRLRRCCRRKCRRLFLVAMPLRWRAAGSE